MDFDALRSAANEHIDKITVNDPVKQGRIFTADYIDGMHLGDLIQSLHLHPDPGKAPTLRQSLVEILILEDFLNCATWQRETSSHIGLSVCLSIAHLALPHSAFAAASPYLIGM